MNFSIKRLTPALLWLLYLPLLSLNLASQNPPEEKTIQIDLDRILQKTRYYCHRLNIAALDFICLEKIKEKREVDFWGWDNVSYMIQVRNSKIRGNKVINEYVYDYQLIRKEGDIKERRILLEDNGRKRYEENAELIPVRFHHENVIFGPIGLLGEFRQFQHDYKVLREETFDDEETTVIEAVPKPSLKGAHMYGKIWVRNKDFSIVKIEWDPTSLPKYGLLEKMAKKMKSEPKVTLISEYGYEKNGIRFPSRYTIEEAYIDKDGKKTVATELAITYRDYKFFIVEVEIKN